MNKLLSKQVIIPRDYHGQRLDVVLAQLFPEFSRSQLSAWLKEGAITFNKSTGKPKDKVLGGEEINMDIDFD